MDRLIGSDRDAQDAIRAEQATWAGITGSFWKVGRPTSGLALAVRKAVERLRKKRKLRKRW